MNIEEFLKEKAGEYFLRDYMGIDNEYCFTIDELISFLEKFKQEICKEQKELCIESEFFHKDEGGSCPYCYVDYDVLRSAPEPKLERGEG